MKNKKKFALLLSSAVIGGTVTATIAQACGGGGSQIPEVPLDPADQTAAIARLVTLVNQFRTADLTNPDLTGNNLSLFEGLILGTNSVAAANVVNPNGDFSSSYDSINNLTFTQVSAADISYQGGSNLASLFSVTVTQIVFNATSARETSRPLYEGLNTDFSGSNANNTATMNINYNFSSNTIVNSAFQNLGVDTSAYSYSQPDFITLFNDFYDASNLISTGFPNVNFNNLIQNNTTGTVTNTTLISFVNAIAVTQNVSGGFSTGGLRTCGDSYIGNTTEFEQSTFLESYLPDTREAIITVAPEIFIYFSSEASFYYGGWLGNDGLNTPISLPTSTTPARLRVKVSGTQSSPYLIFSPATN